MSDYLANDLDALLLQYDAKAAKNDDFKIMKHFVNANKSELAHFIIWKEIRDAAKVRFKAVNTCSGLNAFMRYLYTVYLNLPSPYIVQVQPKIASLNSNGEG